MKFQLRSFSLGILMTTILLGIIYFVDNDSNHTESISVEKATAYLEGEGYQIVEQQQWQEMKKTIDTQAEQLAKDDEEVKQETEESNESEEQTDEKAEESEQEDTEETEKNETLTLEITPGMMIHEISSLLKDHNLIEDEFEFEQYLEENDYARAIQIGTFELKSGMSLYEIAETLTN